MNTAAVKGASNVKLRSGEVGDAAVLGQICYEAFKSISDAHNFPPDFPAPEACVGLFSMLMTMPGVYSVVAENGEGKLLGSNFRTSSGDGIRQRLISNTVRAAEAAVSA